MKKIILAISLLLSLTSVAAENEQQQSAPAQQPAPAANTAEPQTQQPAEEVASCPPGDPNCLPPRPRNETEAGTGATAGGNVHNVLHLGLLLSSPKGNALHEANSRQQVPSPLRTPVKDEK